MAKTIKISKDAMDKLHKGEEISIDDVTVVFDVNEEKVEIDDETKFVIDLKHLLDKHIMKESKSTPGLKETVQFVMENYKCSTKEEVKQAVKEIKELGETLNEDLCQRGKNYIAARQRAGEKSSAYLSGRGVKVCKGQIKGSDGKKKKG